MMPSTPKLSSSRIAGSSSIRPDVAASRPTAAVTSVPANAPKTKEPRSEPDFLDLSIRAKGENCGPELPRGYCTAASPRPRQGVERLCVFVSGFP